MVGRHSSIHRNEETGQRDREEGSGNSGLPFKQKFPVLPFAVRPADCGNGKLGLPTLLVKRGKREWRSIFLSVAPTNRMNARRRRRSERLLPCPHLEILDFPGQFLEFASTIQPSL